MNFNNNTVLIVDANPCMRKVLGNIISNHHYVVTKESTLEGFAWMHKGKLPTCIVLGLGDNNDENFELLDHIDNSGLYNNIPVIVLSGDSSQEHKDFLLSKGAFHYFTKPFNPDAVLSKIHETIPAEAVVLSPKRKGQFTPEKVYTLIPKVREMLTGAMLYLFDQL